jgi:hypothetical protein
MDGWKLFWIGLGTAALSLWYASPRPPLSGDASWWARSSRSYSDWKGSWSPVMVPLGLLLAAIGLVTALT